ncbi:MAG: T9SS type A sorting domain-containing protein [Bacteroidales bacterium]|jgi:hypothetical protein|nr:T9SS type A sorting domain-containing protein [Bacteroidales bacterium]
MKKTVLILAFFMFLFSTTKNSYAQQTVITTYDCETLTDWAPGLSITIQVGIFPLPINLTFATLDNNGHNGKAIKVSPAAVTGLEALGFPAVTLPGILQLGHNSSATVDLATITALIEGGSLDPAELAALGGSLMNLMAKGLPINGTPDDMTAWVKFVPAPEIVDTATIVITATKWNTATHTSEIVGSGNYFTGTAMSQYQKINVPIACSAAPDSISMIVMCGNSQTDVNSAFYIDDIQFTYGIDAISDNNSITFSFYPNPATNNITITPAESTQPYHVALYDMNGKLIYAASSVIGNSTIEVSNVANGIYVLDFVQNDIKTTQKVVVR